MRHRFLRYRYRTERFDLAQLCKLPICGDTALDIGANKGIFSYWISKTVGNSGLVYAFEPQPEMVEHLKKLQSIFGLTQLRIQPVGLSSQPGELNLFRNYAGDGGASLIHVLGKGEKISVPVQTLNACFSNTPLKNLQFVKMDVEGHEVDVILGGMELIQQFMPVLMIECSLPDQTDIKIANILEPLKYKAFFLDTGKAVAHHKIRETPNPDRDISNRNLWFCPEDKLGHFFPGMKIH
ncbi:MAG: FkbM family methyltransferase [Candidatus Cloacimonetes bacterium]|nr:FkbM family methyltransferase [Candidatus Cloacimonadota bacterium]